MNRQELITFAAWVSGIMVLPFYFLAGGYYLIYFTTSMDRNIMGLALIVVMCVFYVLGFFALISFMEEVHSHV